MHESNATSKVFLSSASAKMAVVSCDNQTSSDTKDNFKPTALLD
jgi:hypothetical protein